MSIIGKINILIIYQEQVIKTLLKIVSIHYLTCTVVLKGLGLSKQLASETHIDIWAFPVKSFFSSLLSLLDPPTHFDERDREAVKSETNS